MLRWESILPDRQPGLPRALLVAAIASLLAVGLRVALASFLTGLPFVTFFPAVAGAAVVGGTIAGLLTILAGALIAMWVWLPADSLEFWNDRSVALTAFVVMSSIVVAMIHVLHALRLEVLKREKQLHAVVAEMAHRMGNALSTIQVLIRLSESQSPDVPSFSRAIRDRIDAFHRAQRLTQHQEASDVLLADLCRAVLEPFDTQRIAIPTAVETVPGKHVVMLGLVLNELGTNATKYGALSVPSGHVALSWVRRAGEVHLHWREDGGPSVAPPQRSGGGSRLLDAFRGGGHAAELRYEPAGLSCDLVVRFH